MPSSSKGHKPLPRCTFQARLQQLSPLPGRRRHRSLSSPKTRGAVPHLPCHGHPGMRGRMMKRLTQAPCHSPETSPRPSRDDPAPADKDGDRHTGRNKVFSGLEGVRGRKGQFLPKNAPSSPVKTSRSPLPKLPAAHAPARRPQWRAARRPCPPQPCGRRCGRQPDAPPG